LSIVRYSHGHHVTIGVFNLIVEVPDPNAGVPDLSVEVFPLIIGVPNPNIKVPDLNIEVLDLSVKVEKYSVLVEKG